MIEAGLDAQTLQKLRQVFAKYPAIEQVKLYGSRAKGSFHDRSDIDLAVFGKGVDRFVIAAMLMDLDDTDIPFMVDLQNYQDLRNRRLVEHIDRVGVEIYAKDTGCNTAENLVRGKG